MRKLRRGDGQEVEDEEEAEADEVGDDEEESEEEGEVSEAREGGRRRSPLSSSISDDGHPPLSSESVDERRVRLTKAYLAHLTQQPLRGGGGAGRASTNSQVEDGEAAAASSSDEGDEEMEDVVGHRLLLDAEAAAGRRLHRPYAALYRRPGALLADTAGAAPTFRIHRGHRLSVTCTALTSDDALLYSASKDGSIIEWDVERGRRISCWTHRDAAAKEGGTEGQRRPPRSANGADPRGKGDVLGLAVSSDGRFLATGGMDGSIRVWDTRQRGAGQKPTTANGEAAEEEQSTAATSSAALPAPSAAFPSASPSIDGPPLWCSFSAHRSAVSCLAFPALPPSTSASSASSSSSAHLFSGSHDRTVKIFDVDSRSYIETLFGHTQPVQAIHSYDRSARHHTTAPRLTALHSQQ